MRWWAEPDNDRWVTVRWGDRQVTDHLLPWSDSHVAAHGPTLIEALRGRPAIGDIGARVREDRVTETAFVDEAARAVHWWRLIPRWQPPALERRWPGWSLHHHDGGPRRHLELSGRPVDPIRCPLDDACAAVEQLLASRLGALFDPGALLARTAARMAAEHPGAEVVIHGTPRGGPIGEGPVPDDLARWFADALAADA